MTSGTSGQFVQTLRDSTILSASQRQELTQRLHSQFPEPRALARHLLERNWLTPYQVNQLFLGRSQELVMGPYVILERLGEGGTGQVFKARHQHMHRVVALKLIRGELLSDAEVVTRFYREVRVLSQLSHPNVVHAYDAGPLTVSHFLVMEYVEGTDLGKLIKLGGPLSVERACDYVRQAARGLQHAHERGLVHRDVKPSNLLVTGVFPPISATQTIPLPSTRALPTAETILGGTEVGVVKVLDLGLALLHRNTDGEITSTLTSVGSITMGTPDYMAPEQALDFHAVDIRADVYSLGCTLFYLLTGQPPFPGGTMAQKLMRHQQAPPPPLSQFRQDVPRGVEAVMRRMLAKQPEERYQKPAEVDAALANPDRALSSSAITASSGALRPLVPSVSVALPRSIEKALADPRQRRILLLTSAGGGLVLLVLFAFALGTFFSSHSPVVAAPQTAGSSRLVGVVPLTQPRQSTAKAPPSTPGVPTLVVIPDDATTLRALRPMILPQPGEDRWSAIPWQPSLWAGRQKAASLGKPMLVWATHGHPLGTTCATGMDFRRLAFSDGEVQTLTREFVPVACDGWALDRAADAEGEFYRKAVQEGQAPAPPSSKIGIYCITPDGHLLGQESSGARLPVLQVLRKALGDWNALPEARRQPVAVALEALPNPDPRYHPAQPTKGAVISVTSRFLEADGRGGWKPASTSSAHDRLWLTDAECAAMISARGTPRDVGNVLTRAINRFHRYNLVDNTAGEPELWRPEHVLPRVFHMNINVQPDRLTMTVEGPFAVATSPNLATAERGYVGHMAGTVVIDLAKQEIAQFDFVALGQVWAPGRPDRPVLGVVFEMARDENERAVLPYAATRQPNDYFPK